MGNSHGSPSYPIIVLGTGEWERELWFVVWATSCSGDWFRDRQLEMFPMACVVNMDMMKCGVSKDNVVWLWSVIAYCKLHCRRSIFSIREWKKEVAKTLFSLLFLTFERCSSIDCPQQPSQILSYIVFYPVVSIQSFFIQVLASTSPHTTCTKGKVLSNWLLSWNKQPFCCDTRAGGLIPSAVIMVCIACQISRSEIGPCVGHSGTSGMHKDLWLQIR